MSTGVIVAVCVAAALILLLLVVVLPRVRGKARERRVVKRREEVATDHRERAGQRLARAEYAEQQANKERAEAELHQARAKLHERGVADDELDTERERLRSADRRDSSGR